MRRSRLEVALFCKMMLMTICTIHGNPPRESFCHSFSVAKGSNWDTYEQTQVEMVTMGTGFKIESFHCFAITFILNGSLSTRFKNKENIYIRPYDIDKKRGF